ncbi:MAG: LamG-like jellyroll fold domain-containing protein, partial [Planctomycetota bacterium]
MCRKMIYLISFVLVLGSVSNAEDIQWTDLGADHLWSTPENWNLGRVPTLDDEVLIDVPAAAAPNGPVIQDGIDAKAKGIWTEAPGEPTLTITGGTLEVADWIWWGDGADSFGIWDMSGGTVDVANEFELGWGGGAGTLTMTGGTINARKAKIPTGSAAFGELFLYGGTYNVTGAGELDVKDNGLIDITEGTLVLEGDDTAKVNDLIAAGLITAYGGDGLFKLDYDVRNPGKTTLSASAQLIAYEPFDYPANGLSGNDGGSGWNGAWDGGQQVTAPGLAFSPLLVKGNKATVVGGDSFRDLPEPMGDNETQLWISFVGQADQQPGADMWGGVSFHEPGETLFLGVPWQDGPDGLGTDDKVWGLDTKGDDNRFTEIPITEKIIFVARVDFNTDGDNDTVTAWAKSINDTDPFDLTDETAFAQYTTRNIEFSRVRVAGNQPVNIDEIRLSMTPEDALGLPKALPKGWQSQDIGTTGGSVAESDGTWAISADGADVWNASDEFHYAYVPLSGNGTIVAQVVDNGTGSNGWAKGGVMIRETLDADSKHALMTLTGGEGGGMGFQNRQETGGSSFSSHGDPAAAPPYWVKLTRIGNTITGYSSADGVEWVQQPDGTGGDMTTNPVDIEMAENVYIGLFVTSHASGEIRTYLFDNVSIELPRKMDNWEAAVAPAAPGFLATNIADGVYDIGTLSGDITYEFCVLSNPDETEGSMCLIGRRNYGDPWVGLKYEQWENTGTYGATLFGVADLDYGVATNPGVDTHLVFVSSEDAGTTALYVNGVYKGSVDAAITLSGLVGIGYLAEAEDGSAFADDFDGEVFGVAIYDTALSDEEIAAHSDAFFAPPDVTAPGDIVKGVPDDGLMDGDNFGWPGGETPDLAIDDNTGTKFLHFKGELEPTGIQVTPSAGPTIVTGLTFTTANDAAERDPIAF